jgi:hypothetical protein
MSPSYTLSATALESEVTVSDSTASPIECKITIDPIDPTDPPANPFLMIDCSDTGLGMRFVSTDASHIKRVGVYRTGNIPVSDCVVGSMRYSDGTVDSTTTLHMELMRHIYTIPGGTAPTATNITDSFSEESIDAFKESVEGSISHAVANFLMNKIAITSPTSADDIYVRRVPPTTGSGGFIDCMSEDAFDETETVEHTFNTIPQIFSASIVQAMRSTSGETLSSRVADTSGVPETRTVRELFAAATAVPIIARLSVTAVSGFTPTCSSFSIGLQF